MILVDTSVWADHIRRNNSRLLDLIAQRRLLHHPFVTAELALGSLSDRQRFCAMLDRLPQSEPISTADLLQFLSDHVIHGTGIGMVDAHLLASAHGQAGVSLWSTDKRLAKQAERLGIAFDPA